MSQVEPENHQARRTNTAKLLNPVPYKAKYFGHKLHMDQNEKLIMYGVTHICASDGYSGKIIGFASMPIKNNLEIYEHVIRLVYYNIVYIHDCHTTTIDLHSLSMAYGTNYELTMAENGFFLFMFKIR